MPALSVLAEGEASMTTKASGADLDVSEAAGSQDVDEGRRGLFVALLGAAGASALAGCGAEDRQSAVGNSSAALSGTATVKYVDTIGTSGSPGDLRGLTSAAAGWVAVAHGFYAVGDGGGGVFYWDASSTAADNGGTIIQATGVTTGRWIRIFEGPVRLAWFGVHDDQSVDDTTRVQAALNAAKDIVLSNCRIDSPITVESTVRTLICEGSIQCRWAPSGEDSYYAAVTFKPDFGGSVLGTLRVCNYNSPSETTRLDGVLFNECAAFYADAIRVENVRYGVVLYKCESGWNVNTISGDMIRGYQPGSGNDHGGDFVAMSHCKNGRIGNISGENIYKAAVYLAPGYENDQTCPNDGITIESIDVHLQDNAQSSALSLRSAVHLRVGSIVSRSGLSALIVRRYESPNPENVVDDISIGDITRISGTNSGNASAVDITALYNGSLYGTFGRVQIGNIYATDVAGYVVNIASTERFQVMGTLEAKSCKGAMVVQELVDSIDIGTMITENSTEHDVVVLDTVDSGSGGRLNVDNYVIRSRSGNSYIPVWVKNGAAGGGYADRLLFLRFGTTVDRQSSPSYGIVFLLDTQIDSEYRHPSSAFRFIFDSIQSAVSTAKIRVRGCDVREVFDGRMYSDTIPADSTWPDGTHIYKTSPSSGTWAWLRMSGSFTALSA